MQNRGRKIFREMRKRKFVRPDNIQSASRDRFLAGFALAEVIVSVGLIALVMTGVGVLATRTLAANRIVQQDVVAAQLALEGAELVRNIRDSNWIEGNREDGRGAPGQCDSPPNWRVNLCDRDGPNLKQRIDAATVGTDGLVFDASEPLLLLQLDGTYGYGTDPGTKATPFRRSIILNTESDVEMGISVIMKWCPTATATCPGRERSFIVEDRLFNWIPR